MKSSMLQRYLAERAAKDAQTGGYPFVTISRQSGAGGHTLAEAILARMKQAPQDDAHTGWAIFDRELCEVLAEDPTLNVSVRDLQEEQFETRFMDFIHRLGEHRPSQVQLYRNMFDVIRLLASKGKVILVGRSASEVTHRHEEGIHVRLIAPFEMRVDRMEKLFELTREEAAHMVKRQDHDRARLMRTVSMEEIDDPMRYHLVANTGVTPIEAIADAVVSMIEAQAMEQERGKGAVA